MGKHLQKKICLRCHKGVPSKGQAFDTGAQGTKLTGMPS